MILKDKAAIVASGGQEIGETVCLTLAEKCADVAIADLNEEIIYPAFANILTIITIAT